MPRVIEPPEKLLDLIYDAATDLQSWRSVLTQIADLTNSQGGILFGQSFGASKVYFDYNGRLSEECNRTYKERHVQNPWNEIMRSQPVGRIVFSDEIVPLSSLERTSFFDEVLRPQDVAHNTMVPLAAKDDFTAAFNICRSVRQGPFGEDERRFFERLVPHLCRSVQLGFRFDGYRALQHAEYHVLDRLSAGIILLDRRARVVYANAAARSLSAQGGALSLRGSGITAHSVSHSQRLGDLIRALLRGLPTASMTVPHADGRLLTVMLSSVRGGDVARFAENHIPDVAILLVVIDPANQTGVPARRIMDAYGLTQAEARVALASSSGSTVEETARQLDLSPNTVKTHLRKVYAKTGVSRQAELARLIASISLLRSDGLDR